MVKTTPINLPDTEASSPALRDESRFNLHTMTVKDFDTVGGIRVKLSLNPQDIKMLKRLFAVYFCLALLAAYTTALSTLDSKDDSEFKILSVVKRTPRICRAACDCSIWTRRACNYCKYLRELCRRTHGHEVTA
ncbi:hypothetical protein RRG08_035472 [Elysia crispata]|uniref:Uncharacterized protein n=1 Tax=Elysia crispata TaxID=231223 RepID=A0AAE1E3Y7_9GAST|nr:hypothetical protein RRG08_035472 [Elysia crispata]